MYSLNSLHVRNPKEQDALNCEDVKNILDEHISGREIHDTLIWSLLAFQKWYDLYMDGNGRLGH